MIIKSLDHLQLISKKIAEKISKKDCIFLIGEIGVGKTTLTRSIINNIQRKYKIKVDRKQKKQVSTELPLIKKQ